MNTVHHSPLSCWNDLRGKKKFTSSPDFPRQLTRFKFRAREIEMSLLMAVGKFSQPTKFLIEDVMSSPSNLVWHMWRKRILMCRCILHDHSQSIRLTNWMPWTLAALCVIGCWTFWRTVRGVKNIMTVMSLSTGYPLAFVLSWLLFKSNAVKILWSTRFLQGANHRQLMVLNICHSCNESTENTCTSTLPSSQLSINPL